MEIELYRLTQPRKYCRDYAHTDVIEFIGIIDGRSLRKYKPYVVLDEVMDYERYTHSIDANTSPTFTEDNYPRHGIRVVVVDVVLDNDNN